MKGDARTRIVILGGGFGGIYAALRLEKALARGAALEVTLVNRENFFLFTPMLHEVAASDLDMTHIVNPIRALVRRLQASPAVSDAERQSLGINVRDTTPTTAGAPSSRPVVKVDSSQRLRHVIAFADAATPTRTAKPAGVMGAEIWVKIGPTPPVDPSECTFLALDSRTPYTADYAGADGGKTAHYMLRWVSTNGDKGPWSETASATIGA